MKRLLKQNINSVEYWDGRFRAEHGHDWNPEDIVARISDHLPSGWSVLDVGAGGGAVLGRLSVMREDLRLSACDFSAEAVQLIAANSRLGPCLRETFVYDLRDRVPIPRRSAYQAVICTEVLEHLENPKTAVRHLVQMASEKVIVSVPNDGAIRGPEHLWAISGADLREWLSPYGPTAITRARRALHAIAIMRKI